MAKASFDDYLSIVESGHTKTASFNGYADSGILAKLAEELEGAAPAAAPVAEGQVTPADSTIAAANPAVVGQTEAVQAQQLVMAGASPEVAAAGEMPAQTKPNQGVVISAGDGTVVDMNSMGRTDAAATLAAREDSVAAPATEEEKVAAYLGEVMADSFLNGIVKEAEEEEYFEAVELLKEAGLLDEYDIVDDYMDKTAGQIEDETLGLEKIANGEVLTREDMIKAASELIELAEYDEYDEDEMAKEAEDYGRALAWEYAEELEKEAELDEVIEYAEELEKEAELDALIDEAIEEELEKEAAYEAGAEDGYDMAKEAEMVDELMDDEDVSDALAVLQSRGLI